MIASTSSAVTVSRFLRRLALTSLVLLFALCLLWEIYLAPVRPGGTLLFLKALPLAFAIRGVARGSLYTMQWASMLVLLYLMEGVVRVMSDPAGPSILMAWLEIFLSVVFFFAAIFYVRPAKLAAKLAVKKAADEAADAAADEAATKAKEGAAGGATKGAAEGATEQATKEPKGQA